MPCSMSRKSQSLASSTEGLAIGEGGSEIFRHWQGFDSEVAGLVDDENCETKFCWVGRDTTNADRRAAK